MLAGDANVPSLSAAIDADFTGAEVNDRFLFSQSSVAGQAQLLASEAAAIPAEVIQTFDNGTPAEIEGSLVEFEGVQLFSVAGNLWRTDGTAEGTVRIEGISDIRQFFRFGDEIILTTTDSRVLAFDPLADSRVDNPRELWVVASAGDETSDGRELSPEWFEVRIRKASGPDRWLVSDGTKDGTFLLDAFPTSRTWTIYPLSGGLVAGQDYSQLIAIQPDGTFTDLLPADTCFDEIIGQGADGKLYFTVDNKPNGDGPLWVSDGTVAGTTPLQLRAPNGDWISGGTSSERMQQNLLIFGHRSSIYTFDTETGVVRVVDSWPRQWVDMVRVENYGFRLTQGRSQQLYFLERFDHVTLQSEVVATFAGRKPSELLRIDDVLVFMSIEGSTFSINHFDYRTDKGFGRKIELQADETLAIAVGDGAIFVERTDPATVVVSRIDALRSPTGELSYGNITDVASQYTRPHETPLFPYDAPFRDSALRDIYYKQYTTRIDDRYFAFQAKQVNGGLYISDGTHLGTTRVSEQEARFVTAVDGGIVFQTSDDSLWSARPGESARSILPGDSSWSSVFDLLGVVNGRLMVSLRNNHTHLQSVWAVSTSEFTEITTGTSDHPIGYAYREINQGRANPQEPLLFRVDELSPEEMRERGYVAQLGDYSDSWYSHDTATGYRWPAEDSYRRTWWVTDGTAEGTHELFAPSELVGRPGGIHYAYADFKDGAAFVAVAGHRYLENPSSGELREFDGIISDMERLGDAWIFQTRGEDYPFSMNVWRWADSEAEPRLLTTPASYGGDTTVVEDNLYYILNRGGPASELWRTDGTTAGTLPVSAINDLQPRDIAFIDKQGSRLRLMVTTDYGADKSIWTTDGTEAGTFALESEDSEAISREWTYRNSLVVGDSVVTANTRYAIRSASLELAAEAREISLTGSPGILSIVSEGAATLTADTSLVTLNIPAASSRVTLDVASLLDAPTRELKLVVSDGSVIELLNRSDGQAYYAFDPGCLTISIDGLDLQIQYVGDIRVIDHPPASQVTFYSSEESEAIRFTQVDGLPTVSVASGGQSASVAIDKPPTGSYHFAPRVTISEWYFLTMGGDDEIIVDDNFSVRANIHISSPITTANNASLQIGESFSNRSWGTLIRSTKQLDGIFTSFEVDNHNQAGTNPIDRFDVNFDGVVEPLDALLIINKLNKAGRDPATRTSLTGFNQFADVSGDRMITAYDALMVINHLNRSRHLLQTQAIASFASELASGKHK